MRLIPLIVISALSGCAAFPLLDTRIDPAAAAAPYPALIPLGPLLTQAGTGGVAPLASAGLSGRLSALAARAAALRGPVIDSATRARMQEGVDTSRVAAAAQAG